MILNKESADSTLSKPFIVGWLILLILTGAFLRLHNTDAFYYNPDEAMHTNIAAGDTLTQVLQFSRYEIHPPLLYMITHYWMKISTAPAFVRGISLLFGLILIPLYYRIGALIGGRFTGIACASLIVFSHGCIIQSYVVRQYSIFLFFASLAFYCYLLWRRNPKITSLLAYTLCGMLAALSHFSAIFLILCIALFEMINLWRSRATMKIQCQWVCANALIGITAVTLYLLWQPILVPLKSYFIVSSLEWPKRIFTTPLYPLTVSYYIFIGYNFTLTCLLLLSLVIFGTRKHTKTYGCISLRSLTLLVGIGFLLGAILFISRTYPPLGTRRSLWMLPLLIPPTGLMIAIAALKLVGAMLPQSGKLREPIAALLLFTAGCLLCNPEERFDDGSEYVWQKEVWEDFSHYMATLGPRDLIITEKDDGIMLANLYRSIGEDAFTGKVMAELAPYENTHILFNPYYTRNYSNKVLLATLKEAQAKHLFDGIDRLIFLRMAWSRSPVTDLMLCDALPKQIVTFPAFLAKPPLTRDNIIRARAALMIVPKDTLVNTVLSSHSKVLECFDEKNDMVPGFNF